MIDTLSGILILLIILSILVVAHEFGHFICARICKTRVEEFSLFFGKRIWRIGKFGDTEYNIRLWPLGGFVRIAGMENDDISGGGRSVLDCVRDPQFVEGDGLADLIKRLDKDGGTKIDIEKVSPEVTRLIQSSLGADGLLNEESRGDLEIKQTSPNVSEDEKYLIQTVLMADHNAKDPDTYNSKPIYQRAFMIFGGPLASLLFGYLVFIGMGMTVGVPDLDHPTNQVMVMDPDGEAMRAGIHTGDRIVAINGEIVKDGKWLVQRIHSSADKKLTLTINRGGEKVLITATPESGKKINVRQRVKYFGEKLGYLSFSPNFISHRLGVIESVKHGTLYTKVYITTLVSVVFSPAVKDAIGGPIGMVQSTTQQKKLGFASLVSMAGMFSISLGIMNLLPIPILDGGHLMLLTVEWLRRRRLTPREVHRAQLVGIAILLAMVVLVMYNDIHRIMVGRSFQ